MAIKSIFVNAPNIGFFTWYYSDIMYDSVSVDNTQRYTSMTSLKNLYPTISWDSPVFVFNDIAGNDTTAFINSMKSMGINAIMLPCADTTGTVDLGTWTINGNDYNVKASNRKLRVYKAGTEYYADIAEIANSRGYFSLGYSISIGVTNLYTNHVKFSTRYGTDHVTNFNITGSATALIPDLQDPYTHGTIPYEIIEDIYINEPPLPETDDGQMVMSNSASLNYYHFNYAEFPELRKRLWVKNFLDLFSQYNNKASLIPICHLYPIKIHPNESYTTYINIGDGEKIYVSCMSISPIQKLLLEDKSLIAHFSLSDYPKTNNYIDYPTVTVYKLFLPFIGFIDIDFQYLNKGLDIYYYLDYTTGVCVCNINSGSIRVNEIDFQLAQEIVLAGGDNSAWKQSIWGIVGSVAGLGVMAATGNIFASTSTYGAIKTVTTSEQSPVVQHERKVYHGGNQLYQKETDYQGIGKQTVTSQTDPYTVKHTHGLTPYYVARTVNAFSDLAAMEVRPVLSSSSNPNAFFNSYLHPYLLIRRPTTNIDIEKYKHLEGHPLNDIRRLIDLTGYTEVGNIHLDIDAFENEISEISEILMGGVIINAH